MKKHLKKQLLLLLMLTAMLILPAMSALAARGFGRCKESEAEGRIRDIGKADLVQGKGGIWLSGLSGRSGKRSGDKDCVDEKNEPYFEENCSEYSIYISGACIRKEQRCHDGERAACYDPGADFREEAGDSVRSENCRCQ